MTAGTQVRVTSGKYDGQSGEVVYVSADGWALVQLPTRRSPKRIGVARLEPTPEPEREVIGAPGTITVLKDRTVQDADLRGQIILDGGVTLERCRHLEPTGRIERSVTAENPTGEDVQIYVRAGNNCIYDCEVAGGLWHAGIFVRGSFTDVDGCHVHDVGSKDPAQANLCHGIYWAGGGGNCIYNTVEGCVTHGIHLYPSPNGVHVSGNVLRRNGHSGLIIASQSRNCRIAYNEADGNGRYGFYGYNLTGTGNTALDNTAARNGERAWFNYRGEALFSDENVRTA